MVGVTQDQPDTEWKASKRICAYSPCATVFTPVRKAQAFHSTSCRVRYHNEHRMHRCPDCGAVHPMPTKVEIIYLDDLTSTLKT